MHCRGPQWLLASAEPVVSVVRVGGRTRDDEPIDLHVRSVRDGSRVVWEELGSSGQVRRRFGFDPVAYHQEMHRFLNDRSWENTVDESCRLLRESLDHDPHVADAAGLHDVLPDPQRPDTLLVMMGETEALAYLRFSVADKTPLQLATEVQAQLREPSWRWPEIGRAHV